MKTPVLAIVLLSCFNVVTAQDRTVILKDEKASVVPNGYHISGVIDDRTDKNSIGNITYADSRKGRLLLQNGADGLHEHIEKNVAQDKSTKPVFLHVKQFDMEIINRDGQWLISTEATLVFYSSGYKLIEYSDKAQAEVSQEPEAYAEAHIRKMLDNDLKAFNEWWPENSGSIATSEGVQVNVTIARATDQPGAIVYSLSRPLQISDFTGPSQATGDEAAATLSGSSMTLSGTVENGQTVLTVVITPYFDTRGSWFKQEGKTPEVLAHEQAHFDITAIKACELAQSIREAKFTKDNYKYLLDELQKKNTAATNIEENTYDEETQHGILKDKQEAWQNKISLKVSSIGCY